MSIEITDAKRYELEKDNLIAILLDSARKGTELTEESLCETLNIDAATMSRLITALRNDHIIK